jgi:hypothetical protein
MNLARSRSQASNSRVAVSRRSPEQLDRALEEIAQFSDKIPSLPDEAFSRETFLEQSKY